MEQLTITSSQMKLDKKLNHLGAHLMAMSVLKLFPNAKLGQFGFTPTGFYYDFKFAHHLLEADLNRIEKQMQKLVTNPDLVCKQNLFNEQINFDNQPYQAQLVQDWKNTNEPIYCCFINNQRTNDNLFVDLCFEKFSDHQQIKTLQHFKVLSLGGVYWKGNSENEQLTRIYATAWKSAKDLNTFLKYLEQQKASDHRKTGKDLELFMFDQMSGQGFPIWLPNGIRIRNRILEQVLKLDHQYGFQEVATPIVGEKQLYQTSGHWDHYQASMFNPIKCDHEILVLRPMTCPHHILIYQAKIRSYRDLPYRLSEQSPLFRYEKSGALTGMERVRAMLLTEGHVFVMQSQIGDEIKHCYQMIQQMLNLFDLKIDYVCLSLHDAHDRKKYFDDETIWKKAENDLRKVLDQLGVKYREKIGEAAFYGPKIDIQIKTVLGHEITMATLQLDFVLPKKFNLKYVNASNQLATPVLIHHGLIGTYERFLAILLEQTKGILPFWLAPKQVVIIPIDYQKHGAFANEIKDHLIAHNFYVDVDLSNERISKKIRQAQIEKTKIQIVIGDQELATKALSLRFYGSAQIVKINYNQLVSYLDSLNQQSKLN